MASSNSSDTSSNTIGRTPTPPPPPSPLVATTHFATPPRQTWDVQMAPLQDQQQGASAAIGDAGNMPSPPSEERERGNTATRPRLPSLAPLLAEADLMAARNGATFDAINGNAALHRVEQLRGRIERLRTLLPDHQHRHQVHRRANADATALATLNTRSNLASGPAIGSAQRRREEGTRMIWDSVRGERVSLALFDARHAGAGFMVLACRLARRIEMRVRRVRRRLERVRVGREEEVDRVREWVEDQEMEDEEFETDFE